MAYAGGLTRCHHDRWRSLSANESDHCRHDCLPLRCLQETPQDMTDLRDQLEAARRARSGVASRLGS